jgi:hypothetical protein
VGEMLGHPGLAQMLGHDLVDRLGRQGVTLVGVATVTAKDREQRDVGGQPSATGGVGLGLRKASHSMTALSANSVSRRIRPWLPLPCDQLRGELATRLPAAAATGNPVDLLASASAERYRQAVSLLLDSREVDAVVIIFIPVLAPPAGAGAPAVAAAGWAALDDGDGKVPSSACS